MTQVLELAADLPTITAEINAYKRVAGEAIFEIGRRLKSVRDAKTDSSDEKERRLAEQRENAGGWIRWLEGSVDFDRTQAHRIIEASLQFRDVAMSQRVSIGKIFEMLSLPTDIDRADFVSKPHTIPSTGETKTVDEMTVRELREVKSALKAEREARERAEMRAIKAEESYEVLRDTFDAAFSSPPGDDGVYRIDTSTEVDGTAVRFSTDVRDFIKRYSFLHHYEGEFRKLNACSAEEYHNALAGLRSFVIEISRVLAFSSSSDGIIIDIH